LTSIAVASEQPVEYPRATPDDVVPCHELMWLSVTDRGRRQGTPLEGSATDWWPSSEPLHRQLAQIAAEWWVAEETGSGRLVGFACSIERDGLLELTEFFVRPDQQSQGVGKALLERAFPSTRSRPSPSMASSRSSSSVRSSGRCLAIDDRTTRSAGSWIDGKDICIGAPIE
jgi:GNAT superfamily N-acetyltransferase